MTLKVQLKGEVFPGFRLDCDFEVPVGITALVGPSGAGKSTTLCAIAGLRPVPEGRVSLGDTVWFDGTTRVPVHLRQVAYLFQSRALFPHLTALGNVRFGLAGAPDADARARAMLDRMRVLHLADRRPATYSGGEAQRVALARAFAPKPKLVLLDEPFTALDRPLRAELLGEVRTLITQAQVPAALVTHDPDEAQALATRVIRLDKGRAAGDVGHSPRGPGGDSVHAR